MGSFHLPHQHGERTHTEDLHRELTNIEHFTASCPLRSSLHKRVE